jgi:quinol monooxygenase YgiN
MSYVVVARWRPLDGQAAKVEAILRELKAAVRAEPGNIEFIAHRSNEDPNEYLLYEQYKDEQAFLDHRRTVHFKTLVLERAVPLLEEREIKTLTIVA